MRTDSIPVLPNAFRPIVRRELLAANDIDTKEEQYMKAADSRGRGSGRGRVRGRRRGRDRGRGSGEVYR